MNRTLSGHPDDLLSARLDDELDPATASAVDRHVQHCAVCRDELHAIDEARRVLRAAPPVTAPKGLVGDLVRRRRRADRQGAFVAAVAALLAVVLGVSSTDAADVGTSTDGDGGPKGDYATRTEGAERQSLRQSNGRAEPDPSLTDRVSEAARDLLDFLS